MFVVGIAPNFHAVTTSHSEPTPIYHVTNTWVDIGFIVVITLLVILIAWKRK